MPSNENTAAVNDPNRGVQLLEVGPHAEAQRIDNFLMSHLKGVPKSRIYRLIRKGEVRINKKRAKPDTKLHAGDLVRVPPIRVAQANVVAPPGQGLVDLLASSVLFEDDQMIVINKPQGLAVHLGSGLQIGLIEALRWIKKEQGREEDFLELAHRIDKDTTGCIVIAKNPMFLKYLQAEFKARRVHKRYHAIVHGQWSSEITEVNAPLLKRDVHEGEKIVTVDEAGKASNTHFKLIKSSPTASFIEASPLTGRTHQIRVHCQYAGHPIVGDRKYTTLQPNSLTKIKTLCLHAASIEFALEDGSKISVQAPLAEHMGALLDSL